MHRLKFSVLATAAALSAGLFGVDANALALGRVNVQSALGEPLRAEIELPQITAAEAESLRVTTANADVFRSQGMEYSPVVGNVHVQVQRRADGSVVLRLSSTRPINEPFVDLVLDATWGAGHIVRSYTMLFDPPTQHRAPPAVTVAPQLTAPRAEAAPATRRAAAPQASASPSPSASAPAAAAPTRPAPRVARAPSPPAAADGPTAETESVTVRPGDTAGRIANAHRPASVSLEQMLVAMAQVNPKAFVGGNVNRLRAGTVLQIPSESDAQATPAAQARQIIAAQSRDFNEFRRRLAASAPTAQVAAAERSAAGTVQTQVDEAKPAATSPDKLTLSKGGIQARSADEQLAQAKQSDQNTARLAELSKNIAELNQLSGASENAAAPAAANAGGPGIAVTAPEGLPQASESPAAAGSEATAPPPEAAAATAATTEETAPAPAPAPAAAAPRQPAAPAAPVEEPGILDSLTEDPLRLGGAAALLLALLGFGGYRAVRNRRLQAEPTSAFGDSKDHQDSFFGASGGQRVDTADSSLTMGASSMAYSPSQLDAGGDVDPVAEAEVYLAYGRDLQAEEILKEAMRQHPERTQIPVKLAEIYARRQDRKALEAIAGDLLTQTGGQGPDWSRVADLGRTLDPENTLYQSTGHAALTTASGPGAAQPATAVDTPAAASSAGGTDSVLPALDLDLDLDLDLHEAPPAPAPAPSAFAMAAAASQQTDPLPPESKASRDEDAMPALDLSDLDLDLELPQPHAEEEATAPQGMAPTEITALATEPSPLDIADEVTAALDIPATTADAEHAVGDSAPAPLEFDLGDLSLDLNLPASGDTAASKDADAALPDDPLATKLALAEEFNTIGDSEGARTLVEEVIAEASGDLKARAQRLLTELS